MLGTMGEPSPRWPVDVLLSDGTTAQVRPAVAADSSGLADLYRRVSRETIFFRYFSPRPEISSDEIGRLVHPDGADAVVLVTVRHDQIVGIAQYYRNTGDDDAEVAFMVEDAHQGHGIGTIMLEYLADEARCHGIRRFVAETLAENHKMLGVFSAAGFVRQYRRDAEVIRVVLDIEPVGQAIVAADRRDHVAVVESMRRMLEPRSIAVVGAGRRPGTIGHELLRNLLASGFNGSVYPVNPSADHVASLPCWPSVDAVPGEVDLAVIAVPERAVAAAVEDCGAKGVSSLVVITAGFAEAGDEGARRQRAVTALAHRHGMRIVGPNCFGIINTHPDVSMNATFAAQAPIPGRVGFASQSGGLGIAILAQAAARGLGLSSFVSMGNKADVSGNDLLQWWEDDTSTDVILLYLESFGNPRKFSRVARRVSRDKPIVAVKGGRSSAGTRAASSHTAALASSDRSVDALFKQTGVVRVDTIEELFDTAEVLAHQPLPRGPRVVIIGNAGGPAVLTADACVSVGLGVPELSAELQASLRRLVPVGASVRNPIDLLASASARSYVDALLSTLGSGEVDAAIVISTPPLATRSADVAEALRVVSDTLSSDPHSPPIVASFLGASEARSRLQRAPRPIPCFSFPENAVRALAHAVSYGEWKARPVGQGVVLDGTDPNEARRLVVETAGDGPTWVTGKAAEAVVATYGISVVPSAYVEDETQAADEANRLGFPVAVKAWGPDLAHKSKHGAVHLDLPDADFVRMAFADMAETLGPAMVGATVQRMVKNGVETIVGFVQDPAFGPQVVFGLGGTAVEILDDSVSRMAPLTDLDAREMVLGLRASTLLTGSPAGPTVDIDALIDVVLRMGKLAEDLPEITEADCNPVIATPEGAFAVNARLHIDVGVVVPSDYPSHLR
jgi:acetyl coenzyme A synthetase (ADP forming)-like protein